MKLAQIDSGKFQTKAEGDKTTIFETRIVELDKYDSNYEYVMEYEGKYYAIGEGDPCTEPSKLALHHKLCVYFSLTQIFDDIAPREHIYLSVCSPLMDMNNPDYKEEFKQYLIGDNDGLVSFRVNKKAYTICIKDVLVLPESSGVVYQYPEFFNDRIVGVIDWGGLQINCLLYDDGKPIKTSGFTRQLGAYDLEATIINKLGSIGRNYDEHQLKYVIKNPSVEERLVIENAVSQQLNLIINQCRQNRWNVDTLPLMFTGGSSARYKTYIEDLEKHSGNLDREVSKTALWDNVKGCYEVAKIWLKQLLNR